MMANFKGIQLSSIVPAGNYSMALASTGETWLTDLQAVLEAVSLPRYAAVADFVRLSGTYSTISGIETKQFDSQVGLWSHDWKAIANYNWFVATQNTTVASFWTMEATVWRPTNAEEIVYWFCLEGLAIRAAIEQKQSSGAWDWFLPATTVAGPQAMPSYSAGKVQLAEWIGKLESLSSLARGWNRQGAPAPTKEAIQAARQFIEALVNDGQPPTRVAASAVGGVGVTRQIEERMVYFEFYNDGVACALFADDATEERVLDVPPEPSTFRNLLDEVRAYLNG